MMRLVKFFKILVGSSSWKRTYVVDFFKSCMLSYRIYDLENFTLK